ncbi:MAG: PEP-CTERM/exosortase system-associated acyltransferase [Patescibacteria group bacterium]
MKKYKKLLKGINYKKLRKTLDFWYFSKTFNKKFNFYTTESNIDLDDIFRIRYQVYCVERGFLDKDNYPDNRETDEYDKHSVHFILRNNEDEIAASVRLIMNSDKPFPIEKHFNLSLHVPIDSRDKLAEISRLVVAKSYRKKFLMIALIKGMFAYVSKMGITHVYSVLDDSLHPVLLRLGLPFKRIGQPTIYQGLTSPYIIEVNEMLEALEEKNPLLHKYMSNGDIEYDDENNSYTIH